MMNNKPQSAQIAFEERRRLHALQMTQQRVQDRENKLSQAQKARIRKRLQAEIIRVIMIIQESR